ncbi:alpha/beta fold hydrolase [Marinobacter sp.]|uniref:alpha/beta fold hydrolase n=1 Tax=Marinobacter sp. TaxID=50741 RepID=UPI003565D314
MKPVICFRSEAKKVPGSPRLLLAHGAGAPADSGFMESLASALAEQGVTVLRFEFPYMQKRRQDGRKRPPDRQPVLLEYFREAVACVLAESADDGPVFVGGKSMGGRMASYMIAGGEIQAGIRGAVCFGYPFHPPGKQDRWRTGHLEDLQRPFLVIQGTRDPFGRKNEVEEQGIGLLGSVSLSWLEGGDHDYRPLARQSQRHDDLIRRAAGLAADFMRSPGESGNTGSLFPAT